MGHEADEADGEVVRSVDLPAGQDEVWQAVTEPDRVGRWFGAPVSWDLRPGGEVVVGPGDDGAAPRIGEVDEVLAGHRLRFRWWTGPGGRRDDERVVTYELLPLPEGTRLVVTEAPVPTAGAARASAASRACSTAPGWDLRLVGLWLGCHTRALVRV